MCSAMPIVLAFKVCLCFLSNLFSIILRTLEIEKKGKERILSSSSFTWKRGHATKNLDYHGQEILDTPLPWSLFEHNVEILFSLEHECWLLVMRRLLEAVRHVGGLGGAASSAGRGVVHSR